MGFLIKYQGATLSMIKAKSHQSKILIPVVDGSTSAMRVTTPCDKASSG